MPDCQGVCGEHYPHLRATIVANGLKGNPLRDDGSSVGEARPKATRRVRFPNDASNLLIERGLRHVYAGASPARTFDLAAGRR